MINTQIQKLCDAYGLSLKTRHDLIQMYSLLPIEKQKNIIHNFREFAWKIQHIEAKMKKEQEILLDKILPDVHAIIENRYTYNTYGEFKILPSAI